MSTKISVIMAVYNGEKYILPQLESIWNQTCLPSEVLIFDDGSTDATVQIITTFIDKHGLINWRLICNKENKGWKRNFIEGLKEANGELIFTADQDDIWHPKKLEIMSSVLDREPNAQLVMCEYKRFFGDSFGEYDSVTGRYHWRNSTPRNAEVAYPGCSYAFRKRFFQKISDAWENDYAHDLLIFLAGWMANKTVVCEDTLLYFRRHSESATFIMKPMIKKDDRIYWLKKNLAVMQKLRLCLGADNCCYVDKRITWLGKRIQSLEKANLLDWFCLIKYYEYYPTIRTLFGDLLTIINGRR